MLRRTLPIFIALLCGAALAAPGASASTSAACDGTWQVFPSPNKPGDNQIEEIAMVSERDGWAVGRYGNPIQTLTLRYDGSKWSFVRSPDPQFNQLLGVDVLSAKSVWAVGTSNKNGRMKNLVQRWNGRTWKIMTTPNASKFNGLQAVDAVANDDVWAVGSANRSGGTMTSTILHYDGDRWRSVDHPTVDAGLVTLEDVAAVAEDDVYAAGWYSSPFSGGLQSGGPLLLHWDGDRWSEIGELPPVEGASFEAVEAIATGDVWAAGWQQPPVPFVTTAMHLDGGSWTSTETPNYGDGEYSNAFLSLWARNATDVWGAGFAYHPVGNKMNYRPLLQHYDGSTWTVTEAPTVDGKETEIVSVHGAGDTVWAAGWYSRQPSGMYGDDVFRTALLRRCG